ncbi:Uncharacterised protein [Streptococcus pneumoniae]|nr:Uncharacterised protein [Streptococcus pneumoniae]
MNSWCSISYIIIAPSIAAANRFIIPSIGAFSFFTMLSPNFSIRLPKIQAQYILTKRPMLIPTNWAEKGVTSHPNNITPSKQYICMLNDLNAIRIMLYSFIFLIVIPYHQSNLPGFKLSAISFLK